jgi:transposase InsO family protein
MICVITCMLTKYVIYTACNDIISAADFAKIYHDYVYSHFGLPHKLVSDRAKQFTSKFARELFCLNGIKGNPSTAYHPQTDGQTKRNNQELETYMQIWCSYHQDNWHTWLQSAQFRYNNMTHLATDVSPHMALYGHHPYDGHNPRLISKVSAAQNFATTQAKVLDEVKAALIDSKR